MRLFIAIDLPESVKDYLREVQGSLPQKGLAFVRDFHVTLKFLGDCDENMLEKVKGELSRVSFSPFDSELTKFGTFGGKNPRVVWIGVLAPPTFIAIVREIDDRMSKLGFMREKGEFVSHLTLARVKFVADSAALLNDLNKIQIEPVKFFVSQFHLFESKLTSAGAIHSKLATYPSAF